MDREALLAELSAHVHDERVLDAIRAVPRELFVPPSLRHRAWENIPLPIGKGQTISQPLVVARMCEALELRDDDVVLDVGTGSGYHAAVLARLAAQVVSIERHAALSEMAAASLAAAGVRDVELVVGDGTRGWPARAPYDAINVAADSPIGVPPALTTQLAEGGRMVIPVADRLVLVRRRDGRLEESHMERVRFVPLVEGRSATHPLQPADGEHPEDQPHPEQGE
jgi:protein-L-isoaspartate(D-aspartate) O-methyltransferase